MNSLSGPEKNLSDTQECRNRTVHSCADLTCFDAGESNSKSSFSPFRQSRVKAFDMVSGPSCSVSSMKTPLPAKKMPKKTTAAKNKQASSLGTISSMKAFHNKNVASTKKSSLINGTPMTIKLPPYEASAKPKKLPLNESPSKAEEKSAPRKTSSKKKRKSDQSKNVPSSIRSVSIGNPPTKKNKSDSNYVASSQEKAHSKVALIEIRKGPSAELAPTDKAEQSASSQISAKTNGKPPSNVFPSEEKKIIEDKVKHSTDESTPMVVKPASNLYSALTDESVSSNTSPPGETNSSEDPATTPASCATSTLSVSGGSNAGGKSNVIEKVHRAIKSLKNRRGSSIQAICKLLSTNDDKYALTTEKKLRTIVHNAVKRAVGEGRFLRKKGSFKINPDWVKKEARKRAEAKKKKQKRMTELKSKLAQKKKIEAAKQTRQGNQQSPQEVKESKLEKMIREEAERRKAEEAIRAKIIADRIRKRQFPIEDTKLHAEDQELGVKPSDAITKCPNLPHTMYSVVPYHLRKNHWLSPVADNASQCGTGAFLGAEKSRGLITECMHVYHFFCGDVAYEDDHFEVPKFSLKTLLYAVDEVLNGNAKQAKLIPPLLTYLFVTALRILTFTENIDDDRDISRNDDCKYPSGSSFREDLCKLRNGLNALSWSQICFFYMDLMKSHYESDLSLEDGVLPGYRTLSMSCHSRSDSESESVNKSNLLIECKDESTFTDSTVYFGHPDGALAKGFMKLKAQTDPWDLRAEELMALLRALTDDILATCSNIEDDITDRVEKYYELSKAKRAAETKYRKVKLAFDGPKKPTRQKISGISESKTSLKGEQVQDNSVSEFTDGNNDTGDTAPSVSTVTKKELLAAEKTLSKAIEAYENGLHGLLPRTEPIGFDRHYNSVYFFRNDPEMLHIEVLNSSCLPDNIKKLGSTLNPNRSWHAIDTKSLFEGYLTSLDIRGTRENELYSACSNLNLLKRRLHDDSKNKSRLLARKREIEELHRRLENAKLACDAEDGRRSGRLAGFAQEELKKIEEQLRVSISAHDEEAKKQQASREKSMDYSVLTGKQLIFDLESNGKNEDLAPLAGIPGLCLGPSNGCDENDSIRLLAEALKKCEEKCNYLSSWKSCEISRKVWREQLDYAAKAWSNDCVMRLGPISQENVSNTFLCQSKDFISNNEAISEKRKQNPSSSNKYDSITVLKQCLLDLELRILQLSGQKMAADEALEASESANATLEEDEGERKDHNHWKTKIHGLKRVPTRRFALIRDIIIAAMTVARKAHLHNVVAELKLALQKHQPLAAGQAKSAAIAVLENHGGFDGVDDDVAEVDLDDLANIPDSNLNIGAGRSIVASMLCEDASFLNRSLGDNTAADMVRWRDVVNDCNSVSRLAALTQCFMLKANMTLERLEKEGEVLDAFLKLDFESNENGKNRRKGGKSKTTRKGHDSSTTVWCDAHVTDTYIYAKIKNHPWWPSRVCEPEDQTISNALTKAGRVLISFVGEPSLYLVESEDLADFEDEIEEDLSKFDVNLIRRMQESTRMARRLRRGKSASNTSLLRSESNSGHSFFEEKKSAY